MQRWLGQFQQSPGTAGAPGRPARIGCAAEQDLHAGPPRATAAPTQRRCVWDGPGSGQWTGFAQAALETAVLVPVTIPPFL